MCSSDLSSGVSTSTDPLQLIDVDHVRFYVGNAKQAAFFYASAFGFQVEQIADLTTGSRDRAMYLLTQGNIRIVLESSLTKDGQCLDGFVVLPGQQQREVGVNGDERGLLHRKRG